MKIQYRSPVVLTFFFLSLFSLALGAASGGATTFRYFTVYSGSFADPLFYLRLFTHVLGHADRAHFLGNMVLLLVIGPPLEARYGSRTFLACILLTAAVSGLLQCFLFQGTALLGASGIVFMVVMLSSLAGMKGRSVPLTTVLVAILYLGGEVWGALFAADNVSHFMHLVGGACGTGFGLAAARRRRP